MDKGNITCISKELLNEIGLIQKFDAVKLFANVRNTIHNNGVYTKEDEDVLYNKKLYKFEKHKPPNYGDALDLLVLQILPGVIEVLDKLISQLLNENFIKDPFA
jgi:hypothetical protein